MMRLCQVRRIGAGFATAALIAALAACGGSDEGAGASADSSGNSGGSSAASGKGVITIGAVGTFSGPFGSTRGGIQDTMNAWVKYTNARGGVDGHQIKLIIKDDAGNAATGVSAVRELLTKDHVVALVNDQSEVDQAWAPIVTQAGVPVIGGTGINVPFMKNPNFFASSTSMPAASYGILALAKERGPNIAELYCAESPACANSGGVAKALAPFAGVKIVYEQTISSTAADYTSVCQAIKASGARSFVAVASPSTVASVSATCQNQGANVRAIEAANAISTSMLGRPGTDGITSVAVDFPYVDTSPATATFREALDKYAASDTLSKWGPSINMAWVAMELFKKAVEAGGPGEVTSESLKNGLYTLNNETLGGLAPPLTFKKGQVNLVTCYFVLGISGGKFVAPRGLETSCAPADAVAAAMKTLQD